MVVVVVVNQTAVTIMMMTLTVTTTSRLLLLLLLILLNVIRSRTIEVMKMILKGRLVSLKISVLSLPLLLSGSLSSVKEVLLTLLMTNVGILPIAVVVVATTLHRSRNRTRHLPPPFTHPLWHGVAEAVDVAVATAGGANPRGGGGCEAAADQLDIVIIIILPGRGCRDEGARRGVDRGREEIRYPLRAGVE